MSAAILDIEEDMQLTPWQAELLVGSLNVIAAFGGLIAGVFSACLCVASQSNVNLTVRSSILALGSLCAQRSGLFRNGRPARG